MRRLLTEDERTAVIEAFPLRCFEGGRAVFVDHEAHEGSIEGAEDGVTIGSLTLDRAVEMYEMLSNLETVWSSKWRCVEHPDRQVVIGTVPARGNVLIPSPQKLCAECFEAKYALA